MLREHGVVVAGGASLALVDPIPLRLLRDEIVDTMCSWGAELRTNADPFRNRFYQGFILLNYCRMWCDVTLGSLGSKRRGAEWAKSQLDPAWAELIDRAWDTRPNPAVSVRTPPDPDDFERTIELMIQITESVKRP